MISQRCCCVVCSQYLNLRTRSSQLIGLIMHIAPRSVIYSLPDNVTKCQCYTEKLMTSLLDHYGSRDFFVFLIYPERQNWKKNATQILHILFKRMGVRKQVVCNNKLIPPEWWSCLLLIVHFISFSTYASNIER